MILAGYIGGANRSKRETGVDNVQSGLVDMTAGNNIVNVPVTAVIDSKAVLFFSFKSKRAGQEPQYNFVRGDLSTTTNIRFQRHAASADDIEIAWYLVEYKSSTQVQVQRGIETGGFTTDTDITISAVNPAKSWAMGSYLADGNTIDADDTVRYILSSTTNLKIEIPSGATTDAAYSTAWQVIQHQDYDVTAYDITTDTSTTTYDTVITAVTLNETFIEGDTRIVSGTIDGEEMPVFGFQDAVTIRIYRFNPSIAHAGYYYVVEGNGDFWTYTAWGRISPGTLFEDENIGASKSTTRTVVNTQGWNNSWGAHQAASLNANRETIRAHIKDSNEYRITRANNNGATAMWNTWITFNT